MNQKYMKVSLFEITYKNKKNELFHDILIYWDAPVHTYIHYIYRVMAKNIGTLGKYDQRRLWKLICIVNTFDLLFKKFAKI